MNITIDKNEFNKHVYEIITCKYKKECPASHDYINALGGYQVEKYDGSYYVRNCTTQKTVKLYSAETRFANVINKSARPYLNHYERLPYALRRTRDWYADFLNAVKQIDFYNYLNTPFNRDFQFSQNYHKYGNVESVYKNARATVERNNRDIKRYKDEITETTEKIDKLKRHIERLQKDYENAVNCRTQAILNAYKSKKG